MRRNLTKEEQNFGLGTILYALICLGFAITFAKGMEVSYVTQHYSEILHSFFFFFYASG